MRGSRTSKITIAKKAETGMRLTRVEKERVNDSRLKIQSAADALSKVAPDKIPEFDEIQDCLEGAEESLKGTLLAAQSEEQKKDH